jgi:hypothetical protein
MREAAFLEVDEAFRRCSPVGRATMHLKSRFASAGRNDNWTAFRDAIPKLQFGPTLAVTVSGIFAVKAMRIGSTYQET